MSRRSRNTEIAFGSDSFLDVIANIVGILIILMVISGIRAGNAPVVIQSDEPAPEASAAPSMDVPPSVPATVIEPSPQLLTRAAELQGEIQTLHQSKSRAVASLDELAERERQSQVQIEAAEAQLSAARVEAQERRQQFQRLVDALEESKRELGRLQRTVRDVEQEKSPVTKLKHRVTPISREVRTKEVHFRLLGNRVAHVPVDELVQRMRPQIERQKDFLIKHRRQEGEVGPVEGFSMRYAVEREALSAVDPMSGQGMMRISVSKWELIPQPELQTESIEEAVQRQSAYVRTLRMSDLNAVATFWVYPDSFAIYRRLRDLAYEEGFTVAARPLPFDVPISGSPQGSRSAGQ